VFCRRGFVFEGYVGNSISSGITLPPEGEGRCWNSGSCIARRLHQTCWQSALRSARPFIKFSLVEEDFYRAACIACIAV